MEHVKKTRKNRDEAASVKQPPEPNHTEVIKSQVLARIGKPPRLDRVEVCKQHNRKYRVNIWEHPEPEPKANIAVTPSPRIGLSYYLTVSDKGEIINSNPPMTKLACSGLA